MTRDEIIAMAREFQWVAGEGWTFNSFADLERFAAKVAAKEREACAKVCDDRFSECLEQEAKEIAAAIRARGQW